MVVSDQNYARVAAFPRKSYLPLIEPTEYGGYSRPGPFAEGRTCVRPNFDPRQLDRPGRSPVTVPTELTQPHNFDRA